MQQGVQLPPATAPVTPLQVPQCPTGTTDSIVLNDPEEEILAVSIDQLPPTSRKKEIQEGG